MNASTMLDRELEGHLVVSLEQAVAAPYCGLLLADAGARVIKAERPEGDFARNYDHGADGESVWFAWLNRGKESIAIDLNDPADASLLRRLVLNADIFLHNLAPGALERRGFGGEALRQQNPRLITCQISGYGDHGPAQKLKAYDTLVQAESGICSVTGTEEQPSRAGISVCDIATGLTAFSAILRALIQRGKTGTGIDLSISMFDVMADWMNMPLLVQRYLGKTPARTGLTHPVIAPYGPYATAGDSQIMIAMQNDREWRNFCETVLGRAELGTDPGLPTTPPVLPTARRWTRKSTPCSRSGPAMNFLHSCASTTSPAPGCRVSRTFPTMNSCARHRSALAMRNSWLPICRFRLPVRASRSRRDSMSTAMRSAASSRTRAQAKQVSHEIRNRQ